MMHPYITPHFSALICNDLRRDTETGVRIFKYELTDDTSQYPLGHVVCPQSGKAGNESQAVALAAASLHELAQLPKESRLEIVSKLIRLDSQNWQIGKNKPEDLNDECLADRGQRLLQQSTADIVSNPNGSKTMIMDYDLDQQGISLTQLLEQPVKQKTKPTLNQLA